MGHKEGATFIFAITGKYGQTSIIISQLHSGMDSVLVKLLQKQKWHLFMAHKIVSSICLSDETQDKILQAVVIH